MAFRGFEVHFWRRFNSCRVSSESRAQSFFQKNLLFKIRSSTFVRPVFTLDDFNVSDVKCV